MIVDGLDIIRQNSFLLGKVRKLFSKKMRLKLSPKR